MVDPIITLKEGNYQATEEYYRNQSTQVAYQAILENLETHHKWMQRSINLIASENVVSPAVREAIVTDFSHRYAEGWPGERVYAGCTYIDQVEVLCSTLSKRLFKAEFADVRPISGVTANLVVYSAFTNPGDRMIALSIPNGGHISMARERTWGTAGKVHGLKVSYFPFDNEQFSIDPDRTRIHLKKLEAKNKSVELFMIGASVFLFPAPVKELVDLAHEYDAHVNYDAAHVAGLIAGGQFQDPIKDGVDTMTFSTHKTFFGPQHGMILSKGEHADIIKRGTFPALTSNHHLHNVAGLAVATCEMEEFGHAYAKQVIRNAKALGQALHEQGFNVLGEQRGFTESHILWIDVTQTPMKNGSLIESELERANIIINRNLLPWDLAEGRNYRAPGGIRLGTSEMTRIGMKESEMIQIAEFIKDIVIENQAPKKVKPEVVDFRKTYQKIHYAFDSQQEAYAYINIR